MADNRFSVDTSGPKPVIVDAETGKHYPFADLATAERTAEMAGKRPDIIELYAAVEEVQTLPPML